MVIIENNAALTNYSEKKLTLNPHGNVLFPSSPDAVTGAIKVRLLNGFIGDNDSDSMNSPNKYR